MAKSHEVTHEQLREARNAVMNLQQALLIANEEKLALQQECDDLRRQNRTLREKGQGDSIQSLEAALEAARVENAVLTSYHPAMEVELKHTRSQCATLKHDLTSARREIQRLVKEHQAQGERPALGNSTSSSNAGTEEAIASAMRMFQEARRSPPQQKPQPASNERFGSAIAHAAIEGSETRELQTALDEVVAAAAVWTDQALTASLENDVGARLRDGFMSLVQSREDAIAADAEAKPASGGFDTRMGLAEVLAVMRTGHADLPKPLHDVATAHGEELLGVLEASKVHTVGLEEFAAFFSDAATTMASDRLAHLEGPTTLTSLNQLSYEVGVACSGARRAWQLSAGACCIAQMAAASLSRMCGLLHRSVGTAEWPPEVAPVREAWARASATASRVHRTLDLKLSPVLNALAALQARQEARLSSVLNALGLTQAADSPVLRAGRAAWAALRLVAGERGLQWKHVAAAHGGDECGILEGLRLRAASGGEEGAVLEETVWVEWASEMQAERGADAAVRLLRHLQEGAVGSLRSPTEAGRDSVLMRADEAWGAMELAGAGEVSASLIVAVHGGDGEGILADLSPASSAGGALSYEAWQCQVDRWCQTLGDTASAAFLHHLGHHARLAASYAIPSPSPQLSPSPAVRGSPGVLGLELEAEAQARCRELEAELAVVKETAAQAEEAFSEHVGTLTQQLHDTEREVARQHDLVGVGPSREEVDAVREGTEEGKHEAATLAELQAETAVRCEQGMQEAAQLKAGLDMHTAVLSMLKAELGEWKRKALTRDGSEERSVAAQIAAMQAELVGLEEKAAMAQRSMMLRTARVEELEEEVQAKQAYIAKMREAEEHAIEEHVVQHERWAAHVEKLEARLKSLEAAPQHDRGQLHDRTLRGLTPPQPAGDPPDMGTADSTVDAVRSTGTGSTGRANTGRQGPLQEPVVSSVVVSSTAGGAATAAAQEPAYTETLLPTHTAQESARVTPGPEAVREQVQAGTQAASGGLPRTAPVAGVGARFNEARLARQQARSPLRQERQQARALAASTQGLQGRVMSPLRAQRLAMRSSRREGVNSAAVPPSAAPAPAPTETPAPASAAAQAEHSQPALPAAESTPEQRSVEEMSVRRARREQRRALQQAVDTGPSRALGRQYLGGSSESGSRSARSDTTAESTPRDTIQGGVQERLRSLRSLRSRDTVKKPLQERRTSNLSAEDDLQPDAKPSTEVLRRQGRVPTLALQQDRLG